MSNWQFINSTLFILFVAFKIIFFLKILFVDVWIVWISVFFVFKHSELCCRFEQLGRNSVLCHLAALTPSSLPRPPTQRNTRWDRETVLWSFPVILNSDSHRPLLLTGIRAHPSWLRGGVSLGGLERPPQHHLSSSCSSPLWSQPRLWSPSSV